MTSPISSYNFGNKYPWNTNQQGYYSITDNYFNNSNYQSPIGYNGDYTTAANNWLNSAPMAVLSKTPNYSWNTPSDLKHNYTGRDFTNVNAKTGEDMSKTVLEKDRLGTLNNMFGNFKTTGNMQADINTMANQLLSSMPGKNAGITTLDQAKSYVTDYVTDLYNNRSFGEKLWQGTTDYLSNPTNLFNTASTIWSGINSYNQAKKQYNLNREMLDFQKQQYADQKAAFDEELAYQKANRLRARF